MVIWIPSNNDIEIQRITVFAITVVLFVFHSLKVNPHNNY